MPILQNAKKALRQSKKRELENKPVKKAYKEALKHARKAIDAGEKEIEAKIITAQKTLDKATKKGVLKANTAGRYLSRLHAKATLAKKQ